MGEFQELHLIGERARPVVSHHRGNHFALMVDDIDAWEASLGKGDVRWQRRQRPDGAHQIFLEDPDGHVIELCTSPQPDAHKS